MPNLPPHVYGKHKRPGNHFYPRGGPVTIPVCACNQPKEAVGSYFRCPHCDGVCNVKGGCQRCGTYGFNTNRRLNG